MFNSFSTNMSFYNSTRSFTSSKTVNINILCYSSCSFVISFCGIFCRNCYIYFIDIVIFFSDPLTAQPHDPDVKALLRIAQVFDIPMANNKATADFIITSDYMNTTYTHRLIDFDKSVRDRAEQLEEEEAEKEAEKKE